MKGKVTSLDMKDGFSLSLIIPVVWLAHLPCFKHLPKVSNAHVWTGVLLTAFEVYYHTVDERYVLSLGFRQWGTPVILLSEVQINDVVPRICFGHICLWIDSLYPQ